MTAWWDRYTESIASERNRGSKNFDLYNLVTLFKLKWTKKKTSKISVSEGSQVYNAWGNYSQKRIYKDCWRTQRKYETFYHKTLPSLLYRTSQQTKKPAYEWRLYTVYPAPPPPSSMVWQRKFEVLSLWRQWHLWGTWVCLQALHYQQPYADIAEYNWLYQVLHKTSYGMYKTEKVLSCF